MPGAGEVGCKAGASVGDQFGCGECDQHAEALAEAALGLDLHRVIHGVALMHHPDIDVAEFGGRAGATARIESFGSRESLR